MRFVFCKVGIIEQHTQEKYKLNAELHEIRENNRKGNN